MRADSGVAVINGHDVAAKAKDVRESIALTGQFAAVDELLTGRENLELIGELRHVNDPRDVAGTLLRQFDLEDAADRRTQTYSGGMRRRLDIAMSLIGSPSIIFFDEPTTGLDPQSRNAMWQTIRSLANNGTTIFLTTQYLEEADQLADKIAILKQGKIVAEGTPAELKRLLPQGQVELSFTAQHHMGEAVRLLAKHKIVQNADELTVTVTTDGSVAQLSKLLGLLESAHIEVTEFAQKAPTLDDVFLKIVTEQKEKKS